MTPENAPDPNNDFVLCPCCHQLMLGEWGAFEICEVCDWEDDGQDDHDAHIVRGGPNGKLSLTQARKNFAEFGASSQERLKRRTRPRLP